MAVARLLHQMGYSPASQSQAGFNSISPDRNLQFEYLAHLRDRFQRRHLPIVSVDSKNCGALVVGVSHDTPAFAAHAIAHRWRQGGSQRYPGSRQLLILADTRGRVASGPPQNRLSPSDCAVIKRCPTGTTPSSLKCEVVSA